MEFVVGLDLSLTSAGCAMLWEGGKLEVSSFTSLPTDGSCRARLDRYRILSDKLIRALPSSPQPAMVFVEGMALRGKGRVCDLAEFGAVVRYRLLYEAWAPFRPRVVDIPIQTLKRYATGNGNATKQEMMAAYTKRYNVMHKNDDECDAAWLAQMARAYCDLARPDNKIQKSIIEELLLKGHSA